MKVNIIGAGPAGLYAGILIKRARPDAEVRIFEQNKANATFGFGVVFSDQALAFLQDDDPDTAALIEPHMKRWSDISVVHRNQRVLVDGIGFAGIKRLDLLRLLQRRAAAMGVKLSFESRIDSLDQLSGANLVVAADGLNSIVRSSMPSVFGECIQHLSNRFAWFGVKREYDTLTQTFINSPAGPMNAHHYTYQEGRSTFIIEMTPDTFNNTNFAHMTEPEYLERCGHYFAKQLGTMNLISNHSVWRRFPVLSCQTWHHDNMVLVGDALHTAHFSIGSGTRLALEDVIALVKSLQLTDWDISDALPAYQAIRQPILEKIITAAKHSANWYEHFDQHMELEPWQFALSYIRRAGRIDSERLQRLAPLFTQQLIAHGIDLEAMM